MCVSGVGKYMYVANESGEDRQSGELISLQLGYLFFLIIIKIKLVIIAIVSAVD